MEKTYYEQPYLTEISCVVTRVENKGAQHIVELDRTIFFPEGGGQPSDQGELTGPKGSFKVEQVRSAPDGSIIHQGKMVDTLSAGDTVTAKLKWPSRYKNMRVHSAGHLIHDVLMSMKDGLSPTKGNHGSKAFLEYEGQLDPQVKEELQVKVNEAVARNLPIVTRDAEYDEIMSRCRFVPPNLPQGKQLRIIQIGDFVPMPDGGVQVKSTKEIGEVVIHNISSENSVVTIRYGIAGQAG